MREIVVESATPEVDFQAVLEELDIQLHLNPSADKANVCRLLGREPEPFDIEECVAKTRTALEEAAAEQVQESKYGFSTEVSEKLANDPETESELETPNAYIKRRGLSNDMRPELRRVRAGVITEARDRLSSRIKEDTYHESYVVDVDDEELQASIVIYRAEAAHDIAVCADKIKAIQPGMAINHKIGTLILRALRVDPEQLAGAPQAAFTKEQDRALEEAMLELKDALARFKQGPEAVANIMADQHVSLITGPLKHQVERHYKALVAEAFQSLPDELEDAYSQAARIGPLYEPRPGRPSSIEEAIRTELLVEEPDTQVTEVKELGEINSPFPWLPGRKVRISAMDDGERQLLFCEAIIPSTRNIGTNLRLDLHTAKKLDSLRERIKEIEFEGNASKHNQIRAVKHPDFHDLTICYYANYTKNGLRVYYCRTQARNFDAIADSAQTAGLDPDIPLLVLLAETDKAHQLKVLGELGVNQRAARLHAGPV